MSSKILFHRTLNVKNFYLTVLFILITWLINGCTFYKFPKPNYNNNNVKNLINVNDTFLYCYNNLFLLDEYEMSNLNALFLYKQDEAYFVEYYSRNNNSLIKNTRKKIKVPEVALVFDFISQCRLDTIKSTPGRFRYCDHCPVSFIFINNGKDTSTFYYDHFQYEMDSVHEKSKLQKLISEVVADKLDLPKRQ